MACNCNKGAKKVAPIKNVKKDSVSGINTNGRAASSVRRVIKRPSR